MFAGVDSEINAMLDARFTYGPTRYLLLSEIAPTFDRTTGYTGFAEPTAASYARLIVPGADWPSAADRAVELAVLWPDTVDDLGDIGWWGLAAGPTSGLVAWAGRFAAPIPLAAGTSNLLLPLRIESPDQFTDLT